MAISRKQTDCIKQCTQPCYEVNYETQVTSNSYPRVGSTYYTTFQEMLPNAVPPDISQHIVQLNVYFQVS
jgi:hypothetical protein